MATAEGSPERSTCPRPDTYVDHEAHCLTIRVAQSAQLMELPGTIARALENHEYEPGIEICVDCRGCDAPDARTVHMLAGLITTSRAVLGQVHVRTDSAATFGMGRMLEILVGLQGDYGVHVVDEHDADAVLASRTPSRQ